MIVISERINGLFRSVGKAIDERDADFIKQMALDQVKAGSNILDVNTGPGRDNESEDLSWMVKAIQEVTDVQLSIDTPNPKAMEAGLKAVNNKAMMNSTTAEQKKMETLFPLTKEYDAEIVCLTLDEKGIPNDAMKRNELAMLMITTAMGYDVPVENIYIDPLIIPVGAAQNQGPAVIEAINLFKMLSDPPPKTVVGLSNISNGTKQRSLINRTYLAMLMGAGLTAAIMDPSDKDLMKIAKTGEILLNKKLYAHDYLQV
ncbi:MAG: dihydropteroate synthase DHPS [Candidatus Altiarchaeales archaeon WOR_SM1_79]|nr:MAG: dihydropteroate synthase DHPS [Candidatus Altiarchaeales archaeon WOR_SM1_79]